jgi:hypothetical protein
MLHHQIVSSLRDGKHSFREGASSISLNWVIKSTLGAVYTMDHEVVPRKRPILRGTISMARVTILLVFMVHGSFTRCKSNVDHEE